MRKSITGLLVSAMLLSVVSCALPPDYKFGDLSKGYAKSYCASTDPEFREVTKKTLSGIGFNVGVDFCTARNLIDAMIAINEQTALPVDYGEVINEAINEAANETDLELFNSAKVQNQNFERRQSA